MQKHCMLNTKNGSGAMIKATMPINPDGSFSLSINDNNNTTSRAAVDMT